MNKPEEHSNAGAVTVAGITILVSVFMLCVTAIVVAWIVYGG